MKIVKITLLLSLFILPLTLSASIDLSIGEAINLAGRQRMLTQRIAKAYVLHHHYQMDLQANQLETCQNLFETSHQRLLKYDAGDTYAKRMLYIGKLWKSYQFMLEENSKDAEFLGQLLELSDKLLKNCNLAVKDLELHATTLPKDKEGKERNAEMAGIINVSGRQRMLSQRILLYGVAYQLNSADENNKIAFETAVKDFKKGLRTLMIFDLNTKKVDVEISNLLNDWKKIEAWTDQLIASKTTTDLKAISKLIDQVLLKADDIVKLYEDISDNGMPAEQGVQNFGDWYNNKEE